MPNVDDYKSSSGKILRELYALAVIRSLSPREKRAVMIAVHGETR